MEKLFFVLQLILQEINTISPKVIYGKLLVYCMVCCAGFVQYECISRNVAPILFAADYTPLTES